LVFQAAAAGAERVYADIEGCMCNQATVPKVRAFLTAFDAVKKRISEGAPRSEFNRDPGFWVRWKTF
jgi:hypothetical protein